MKKFKNSIFYIFILVFFSGIIYYILELGKGIELSKVSKEVIWTNDIQSNYSQLEIFNNI